MFKIRGLRFICQKYLPWITSVGSNGCFRDYRTAYAVAQMLKKDFQCLVIENTITGEVTKVR